MTQTGTKYTTGLNYQYDRAVRGLCLEPLSYSFLVYIKLVRMVYKLLSNVA